MTRAWLVDFFVSLFLALTVFGGVLLMNGPSWAAFGFALTVYFLRSKEAQHHEATR